MTISSVGFQLTELTATTLAAVFFASTIGGLAQKQEPLALWQTIPLPGLHDGDLDHFAVDLQGHRLFLSVEHDSAVDVFDLQTNKLIHTISDVKRPHSIAYRADLKKLFVVDGAAPRKSSAGWGEVKIYESDAYKPIGSIRLKDDADSSIYDPSTQYMYVVNGGKDSNMDSTFISVIDTTTGKKLDDIKIDSDSVEAMALEKAGSRLFANVESNAVAVVDREKLTVIATWPIGQEAKQPAAIAFDEAGHRLFVSTHDPAKLIVLDSDSGKVVTSLPCVAMSDDMTYDSASKRIYIAGSGSVDVFRQHDTDHYKLIGQIASALHAQTATLVPELGRYYLAVPHHGDKQAGAVLVYKVVP
jgi:DNA-binding beta-propeller fold protein YncE